MCVYYYYGLDKTLVFPNACVISLIWLSIYNLEKWNTQKIYLGVSTFSFAFFF